MHVALQEVEFVYRTTRSIEVALEDDIRRNLEGLGFRVINKGVVHDEFNQRTAVSSHPAYFAAAYEFYDVRYGTFGILGACAACAFLTTVAWAPSSPALRRSPPPPPASCTSASMLW